MIKFFKCIPIFVFLIFAFPIFPDDYFTRPTVNTTIQDLASIGNTIYTASLVVNADETQKYFVIDKFTENEYQETYRITPQILSTYMHTCSWNFIDHLKITAFAENDIGIFIYNMENVDNKNDKTLSYLRIKNGKILTEKSIDLNEAATSEQFEITWNGKDRIYCVLESQIEHMDICLCEFDLDGNLINKKIIYTSGFDYFDTIFCIKDSIYLVGNFNIIDFYTTDFTDFIVLDKNLNIVNQMYLEYSLLSVTTDGENIIIVDKMKNAGLYVASLSPDFKVNWEKQINFPIKEIQEKELVVQNEKIKFFFVGEKLSNIFTINLNGKDELLFQSNTLIVKYGITKMALTENRYFISSEYIDYLKAPEDWKPINYTIRKVGFSCFMDDFTKIVFATTNNPLISLRRSNDSIKVKDFLVTDRTMPVGFSVEKEQFDKREPWDKAVLEQAPVFEACER